MISEGKLGNALYALQGVLVKARQMVCSGASAATIADILDSAEMLPRLISSKADETDRYRRYLSSIAHSHKCAFVLERFDEPIPSAW